MWFNELNKFFIKNEINEQPEDDYVRTSRRYGNAGKTPVYYRHP